jgi:hypothetical protein
LSLRRGDEWRRRSSCCFFAAALLPPPPPPPPLELPPSLVVGVLGAPPSPPPRLREMVRGRPEAELRRLDRERRTPTLPELLRALLKEPSAAESASCLDSRSACTSAESSERPLLGDSAAAPAPRVRLPPPGPEAEAGVVGDARTAVSLPRRRGLARDDDDDNDGDDFPVLYRPLPATACSSSSSSSSPPPPLLPPPVSARRLLGSGRSDSRGLGFLRAPQTSMCRSSRDEANARPQISHCTRLGVPAGRRAAALDGRGMGTACRVGALGLPESEVQQQACPGQPPGMQPPSPSLSLSHTPHNAAGRQPFHVCLRNRSGFATLYWVADVDSSDRLR